MAFIILSDMRTEVRQGIKNIAVSTPRIDRWINDSQDDLASEMDPDHLQFTTTLSTVAAQRQYLLEIEFNKIISMNNETQDQIITQIFESEIEDFDPNLDDTGTPDYFSAFGYSFVQAQPLSASTVDIVSDAAGDTTQSVRINGVVNGVRDTELLALNGVTTVTGTKSFSSVHSVTKDLVTTGKVTVNVNDASNTVIAEIARDELMLERQPVNFYPVPSGVETIRVRGIRKPRRMVNAEDIPDFPSTYHRLVQLLATHKGHLDLFRPTVAGDLMKNVIQPEIDKLKAQMGNKRSKTSPVIRGRIPVLKGGRLPSSFPIT